jgi:hypothetical protein
MVQTPIVEARLSLANADSHFQPSQLLGLVVKLCRQLRGVLAVSGGHVTSYGGVTPRVVEVLVFRCLIVVFLMIGATGGVGGRG